MKWTALDPNSGISKRLQRTFFTHQAIERGLLAAVHPIPSKALKMAEQQVAGAGEGPIAIEVYARPTAKGQPVNIDEVAETIRQLKARFADRPNVAIGVGTADKLPYAGFAIEAGADFVVNQGFDPAIVALCAGHLVATIQGVSTPAEVVQLHNLLTQYYPVIATNEWLEGMGFDPKITPPSRHYVKIFSARGKGELFLDEMKTFDGRDIGFLMAGGVQLATHCEGELAEHVASNAAGEWIRRGATAWTGSCVLSGDIEGNVRRAYEIIEVARKVQQQ